MTKAFCSSLIFIALLAVGQSSARLDPSAARRAAVAQIQRSGLRIEFDQNLHSRVIAQFGEEDTQSQPAFIKSCSCCPLARNGKDYG
jgi:hypothetical protein